MCVCVWFSKIGSGRIRNGLYSMKQCVIKESKIKKKVPFLYNEEKNLERQRTPKS